LPITPQASLSILLLLFGVSQASPLMEEGFEGVFVSEPERVDITTMILETNNGSSDVLVFPKTRNALYWLNNNCFLKKNSNNIVEVPYIINWCFSSLGRTGGKQVVSLNRQGCVYHGIAQHELSHALGFYHEQTRSDRDQYVRINWKNISPDMAYNFQNQKTNNQNTPYDYGSVMHYGKTAFSIQPGLETITSTPDKTVEIGQRQGMSNIDILRINKLYGC
uniref:Metalloendopeptidase n=1 Tax=Cyprinus carpio TaxID=7962 RepID=A0A8C2D3I9_CYPCA